MIYLHFYRNEDGTESPICSFEPKEIATHTVWVDSRDVQRAVILMLEVMLSNIRKKHKELRQDILHAIKEIKEWIP